MFVYKIGEFQNLKGVFLEGKYSGTRNIVAGRIYVDMEHWVCNSDQPMTGVKLCSFVEQINEKVY